MWAGLLDTFTRTVIFEEWQRRPRLKPIPPQHLRATPQNPHSRNPGKNSTHVNVATGMHILKKPPMATCIVSFVALVSPSLPPDKATLARACLAI